MRWTARDVMQTGLRVADPDTRLPDLERMFLAEGITGCPVVSKGRLVGMVSRSDIVRQLCVERSLAETLSDYYRASAGFEAEDVETLEEIAERVGQRIERLRVKDVMIRTLIAVAPDQPLREVARMLVENHIHRVPVTTDDRLLGIVTSLDLVRLFAEDRVKPA